MCKTKQYLFTCGHKATKAFNYGPCRKSPNKSCDFEHENVVVEAQCSDCIKERLRVAREEVEAKFPGDIRALVKAEQPIIGADVLQKQYEHMNKALEEYSEKNEDTWTIPSRCYIYHDVRFNMNIFDSTVESRALKSPPISPRTVPETPARPLAPLTLEESTYNYADSSEEEYSDSDPEATETADIIPANQIEEEAPTGNVTSTSDASTVSADDDESTVWAGQITASDVSFESDDDDRPTMGGCCLEVSRNVAAGDWERGTRHVGQCRLSKGRPCRSAL